MKDDQGWKRVIIRRPGSAAVRSAAFRRPRRRRACGLVDCGHVRYLPARFGEIEQRGLALTPMGRALYDQLLAQARALVHGERDRIANAANLSALVYHALPHLNWVGFYFFDGKELVVGPFQGLPACVRIPLDKGVCGAAASQRVTQRIEDVDAFPGHIACDSASRSELVVPLVHNGNLVGVFDLDSPSLARFDAEDQAGLEAIAAVFVEALG